MDASKTPRLQTLSDDDDDCVIVSSRSTGQTPFDPVVIKEEPTDNDDNDCQILHSRTSTPTEAAAPGTSQKPGDDAVIVSGPPSKDQDGSHRGENAIDLTKGDEDVAMAEAEPPKDAADDVQMSSEPTASPQDAEKDANTKSKTSGPEATGEDAMDIVAERSEAQKDRSNSVEARPEVYGSSPGGMPGGMEHGAELRKPQQDKADDMDVDAETAKVHTQTAGDKEISPAEPTPPSAIQAIPTRNLETEVQQDGESHTRGPGDDSNSRSDTYRATWSAATVQDLIASQARKMLENKRLQSLYNNAQGNDNHQPGSPDQHITIEDDDDSDAEATQLWLQAEREFDYKVQHGIETREDQIDYERAKKIHMQRMQRKLEEDRLNREDPNGLFVPTQQFPRNKHPAPNDGPVTPAKRRNLGGHISSIDENRAKQMGFDHYFGMDDETEPPASKDTGARGSRAKKGRGGRPKGSTTKKPTKAQLKQQRASRNITNLTGFDGDVFRDVQTNTARDEQPMFTSRRKQQALEELIKSIPVSLREDAKLDKKQIEQATKSFTGRGSCYSDQQGGWVIKGINGSATNYQMIGIARMRDIEKDADSSTAEIPCGLGGLLADWMGLGKTFEMLCNIINGLLKIKDGEPRTTLIVSSPSIILQWLDEIAKFVKEGVLHGEPIRYTGRGSFTCKNPVNDLYNHDIVLTTYTAVQRSYPKCDPPMDAVTAQEKQDWWDAYYEEHRGDLHRMTFHRVVLDEAQAIKNHNSQTSVACRALTAKYYWAMTGTPIQNRVAEFYPYFKFLRIPNTGTYKVFQHNYCREGEEDCTARLHAMLSKFMIRRTHNDELLGSKLLVLPETKKETMKIHFSELEHEIYEIVKKRFASRINGMVRDSKDGELSRKRYSHILTMILRLRQLTGHILLIHDTIVDLLQPEDHDKLREVINRVVPQHRTEKATIKHLRVMLANPKLLTPLERTSQASSETGSDTPGQAEDDQPVGRAFGLKNNFGEYLDNIRVEQAEEKVGRPQAVCSKCKEVPQQPHTTSCNHLYCYECLQRMTHESIEKGQSRTSCVVCEQIFVGSQAYNAQEKEKVRKEKHKKQQGDGHHSAAAERESIEDPMAELEAKKKRTANTSTETINTWIDSRGHMIPSAKTLAIKAQILQWLREDPSCKIIVYSQFITMIKILTKMAQIEKLEHCVFAGTQSAERRAKVIDEFKKKPEKKVMFASLKSGCNGLNLTMASRVIMVDLWWNSLTEQQAFCRSYRRGQDKETALMRFVVQGSIDDHLQEMQERKDKNIDSVLAPTSDPKERMSTKELMSLFGTVQDDADGDPFILVEDAPARTVKTKQGQEVTVGPRVVAADEEDDPAMAQEM